MRRPRVVPQGLRARISSVSARAGAPASIRRIPPRAPGQQRSGWHLHRAVTRSSFGRRILRPPSGREGPLSRARGERADEGDSGSLNVYLRCTGRAVAGHATQSAGGPRTHVRARRPTKRLPNVWAPQTFPATSRHTAGAPPCQTAFPDNRLLPYASPQPRWSRFRRR